MGVNTSTLRPFDIGVIAVLVALLLLWILHLFLLSSIYKLNLRILRVLNEKRTVDDAPPQDVSESDTTPLPLLEEEEEIHDSQEAEVSIPISNANFKVQYGRRSLQLPSKTSSSSPDIPSNVYDEITNVLIPKKYLSSFATVRHKSSRKRKRLGAVKSGNHDTLSSTVSDAACMTGGTVSHTSELISGLSLSIEESAKTPNTAYDGTNCITFRPDKKTIPEEANNKEENSDKKDNVENLDQGAEQNAHFDDVVDGNRQTYMNMENVCQDAEGTDEDIVNIGDYVPMKSVMVPFKRSYSLSKRPQPTPRSIEKGFYISDSPTWRQKQDGSTKNSPDVENGDVNSRNRSSSVFFPSNFEMVCSGDQISPLLT